MEALGAGWPRPGGEPAEAGGQFELREVSRAEPAEVDALPQVSREIVRLYEDVFGRRPEKARSQFAGQDTLICTLEGTMSPRERKRVEMGGQERMRYIRMFFRHSTDTRFRSAVEDILGRRVRSFASSIDPEQDISSEVFYFEPRS